MQHDATTTRPATGIAPRRPPRPVARARGVLRRALGVGAALLLAVGCEGPAATPPNVLVYVVDTLRADALASYGNPDARTPHFDALAAEGALYENAYANASWTRASVGTLLTGLLPWHHGAESRDDRLPEAARTLAELFAERGYATALISANPNVGRVFGFQQAFDEVGELYARSRPGVVGGHELVTPSTVVTNEIVQWLRDAPRPFFVVALPIDPHYPYRPPRRHDPARHRTPEAASPGRTPGDERVARTAANAARQRELYQAEVAFNDESFGALVAALRQLDAWDDTIVLVTSDHGEEFWEYGRAGHGKSLSEEVLRVPLILRAPGDARVPPGGRVARRVSLVDLAPTLLELAGLPVPGGLDGRSFVGGDDPAAPVVAGLRLDGHDLVAAIGDDYKLVWDRRADRHRLYDLRAERPEARPLPPDGDAAQRAAVARLAARLDESLDRPDRTLEKSRAGELPEPVEQSLRALGYLE